MSDVTFLEFKKADSELAGAARKALNNIFSKGKIAIKLHMGESGNKNYIKPAFVKIFVDILKENGAEPFLFDSPVMYLGGRDTAEKYLKTAAKHGFTEQSIGCPIIISNESIKVKTEHMDVEVCKKLSETDSMLVLSHVKGHMCCGFGGAIKNLGMGGVSTKSKKDIHKLSAPIFDSDCIGCETCIKTCPVEAISMKDSKAVFDYSGCWGCGQCILSCPSNVLKPKVADFDTLLAEGAYAVVKDKKQIYYVNFLNNIAKLCDCCSDDGGIIAPDIGILFSKDIVSIEKASLDLINKSAGKEIFKEHHMKSGIEQIKAAKRLGMGTIGYKLENF